MINAEEIKEHYKKFLQDYEYLPFANHIHPAWPDISFEGMEQYFEVARKNHNSKWVEIDRAQNQLAKWISDFIGNSNYGGANEICLGQNDFDFYTRFFSSLNLEEGDCVITTDRESPTLKRLLQSFKENSIQILEIELFTEEELEYHCPSEDFHKRMKDAIATVKNVKAVCFSSVNYYTGNLIRNYGKLMHELENLNCPILLDVSMQIGPLQFEFPDAIEERLYILGSGDRYLEFGENVAWLRVPENSNLRPLYTGWMAERAQLCPDSNALSFPENAKRFLGDRFEPCSLYRALSVINFMEDNAWTPQVLERKFRDDIDYLYVRIEELLKASSSYTLVTDHNIENRSGVISIFSKECTELHSYLMKYFIETHMEDDFLTIGVAPYTSVEDMDKLIIKLSDFFGGIDGEIA